MGKIALLLGYVLSLFTSIKKIIDVWKKKTPEQQTQENKQEKKEVEEKIENSNLDELNKDVGWKN